MKLSSSDAKLISRAAANRKIERVMCWALVAIWPIWVYFDAHGAMPRLELPMATLLFLVAGLGIVRPMVDRRVLELLRGYISNDPEALECIARLKAPSESGT